MRLYHGTTEKTANLAVERGLRPRGRNRSKWEDCPSSPDHVYLTDSYALHYAANSSTNGVLGIVEVDTAMAPSKFVADEDALAQAHDTGRWDYDHPALLGKDLIQKTLWFRKRLGQMAATGWDADWSLKVLGNCAFEGHIPSKAISRVVLFKPANPIFMFFDPTITLMNYAIMKSYYRAVQLAVAGRADEVAVSEIMPTHQLHYELALSEIEKGNLEVIYERGM